MSDPRPLLVHVLYRFAVGGLENGVVNLINHLPDFRHAIVCVSDHDPSFAERLRRDDVTIHELHKKPGQDPAVWWRLFRLLRQLKPALVHTRNLSALEAQLPAWLAGVPARVHSEHGFDAADPDGTNKTYQRLRFWLTKLAQRIIPLSQALQRYLCERVGVAPEKITQIYNGVDCSRFDGEVAPATLPALLTGKRLFGTVGRLQLVKDQLTLIEAFIVLRARAPEWAARIALVLVGDGPLREQCETRVHAAGLQDSVWFCGERSDIPALMRVLEVFVLPSRAEGISNTILEAMASGLPVIATDVGGNAELVVAGETGFIVPRQQPEALAEAMARYLNDTELAKRHGAAGRARVLQTFSLPAMVKRYEAVYRELLEKT